MKILDIVRSTADATVKLVFSDGETVSEVTYLNKGDGKDILVVPTQSSYQLGCQFCHLTGLNVPIKNLNADSIVEMVRMSSEELKLSESGNKTLLISYMGAGEPLMNIFGVITSALRLRESSTHETTRFAVATLIPGEKPFRSFLEWVKSTGLNFKLHWSLHSVDQATRKQLMPAALDLQTSAALVADYVRETGRPAEIHYTLMADVNDRPEDVANFNALVADKGITVKLLRFSPREEASLRESERVDAFQALLTSEGFATEVYSPPGRDIGSSCGQFRLDNYTPEGKKSLPVVTA